ncbi:MAG: FeoA family protein [Candidatus Omnitrophota bacterium]
MVTIDLPSAPSNTELVVLAINAGMPVKKRLISMGIHAGDKIIKFHSASWGPILIRNNTVSSSKIAIGRRLAAKINVEYESE